MKGDCTAAFEGGSCVDSEYKSTANEASTGMIYSFFTDPANECALNHAMAAFKGEGTAGKLADPFQSMNTTMINEQLAPPPAPGCDVFAETTECVVLASMLGDLKTNATKEVCDMVTAFAFYFTARLPVADANADPPIAGLPMPWSSLEGMQVLLARDRAIARVPPALISCSCI